MLIFFVNDYVSRWYINFRDSPSFEIEHIWNRTWKRDMPEDLNITLNVWRAIRGKGNVMLAGHVDENAVYVCK